MEAFEGFGALLGLIAFFAGLILFVAVLLLEHRSSKIVKKLSLTQELVERAVGHLAAIEKYTQHSASGDIGPHVMRRPPGSV